MKHKCNTCIAFEVRYDQQENGWNVYRNNLPIVPVKYCPWCGRKLEEINAESN